MDSFQPHLLPLVVFSPLQCPPGIPRPEWLWRRSDWGGYTVFSRLQCRPDEWLHHSWGRSETSSPAAFGSTISAVGPRAYRIKLSHLGKNNTGKSPSKLSKKRNYSVYANETKNDRNYRYHNPSFHFKRTSQTSFFFCVFAFVFC